MKKVGQVWYIPWSKHSWNYAFWWLRFAPPSRKNANGADCAASSVQKVNINVCAYYMTITIYTQLLSWFLHDVGVSLLWHVFLIVHGCNLWLYVILLLILCTFFHSFCVPQIIVPGNRQCTSCLAPSGQTFSVVQCGAIHPPCKVRTVLPIL